MSQNDAILDYLRAGNTLTPAAAYSLFGTLALHSRITELRDRGHVIDCRLAKVPSGKTVGHYTLRQAEGLAA